MVMGGWVRGRVVDDISKKVVRHLAHPFDGRERDLFQALVQPVFLVMHDSVPADWQNFHLGWSFR